MKTIVRSSKGCLLIVITSFLELQQETTDLKPAVQKIFDVND